MRPLPLVLEGASRIPPPGSVLFGSLPRRRQHPCRRQRRLEPVQAKGVLCGGVSQDHVRVVEHVEAVQRQRVDFQVIQGELGVHVEADVRGQGAGEVLGEAGGRLPTDCSQAETHKNHHRQLDTDVYLQEGEGQPLGFKFHICQSTSETGPGYHVSITLCGMFDILITHFREDKDHFDDELKKRAKKQKIHFSG